MYKRIPLLLTFGCISAMASTAANYDLLGRKGSKMNSPMVYRDLDYSSHQKMEKQKIGSSLENRSLAKRASGIKGGAKAIVGKFGPKGYNFRSCTDSITGCGEKLKLGGGTMSLSSYLEKVNSNFINVTRDERALQPEDATEIPNFVSAGPTRSGASGFTVTEVPYSFTNPIHAASFDNKQTITYKNYKTIDTLVGRNHLSSTNVGVYLAEEALPTRLNPRDGSAPFILADNASMNDFETLSGFEMRASRMYKVLKRYSDRSVVYAKRGRPSNPASANPQIYMGLKAYGGSPETKYSTSAKILDNYIYDNRTVEIVGAGNSAGNFSADAYATNAITVGALDPLTNKPTTYSAKNKPWYRANGYQYPKPDVYNYSNFYINDYKRTYTSSKHTYEFAPYYDGTEASAAITAGMISNMLSVNEFYRWHPEVVKAVAINRLSDGYVTTYDDFVFDQTNVNNIHHSYYFIGDVNTLMKDYGRIACPGTDVTCGEGKKEIRLKFTKYDLVDFWHENDVDGFVASIAWLNSGNDISNLGELPQKFEIEIYHHPEDYNISIGGAHLDSWSYGGYSSDNTPYKSVGTSGYADSYYSLEFTIRIILTEEDTRSENYGQMVLGLDIIPILKPRQW